MVTKGLQKQIHLYFCGRVPGYCQSSRTTDMPLLRLPNSAAGVPAAPLTVKMR